MSDHDDEENVEDLNNENALVDEADEEDEESVNPLAHLPDFVLARVARLEKLNDAREKIMEQYLAERAALEIKYSNEIKHLYEERAAIVAGEMDEEIAAEAKTENPADAELDVADTEVSNVKGIPQFWACAMAQVESIGELITEEDVDCLEYLRDIVCEEREDGKGFALHFHFAENEYFKNTILSKHYVVPNMLLSDEPILKHVSGTKIEWKPNKCLTSRTIKKKQRGKGKNAGQIRTVTKTEKKESFFHWFEPPEMPPMDDLDEEEAERLEEIFDEDYDIAQSFRSHVIPKAVLWFTGKAIQQEMENVMEDGVDDDGDGEDQ